MKTVTIDITNDGSKITIDMDGFQGIECAEKTRDLISKLGTVTDQNFKSEYELSEVHYV